MVYSTCAYIDDDETASVLYEFDSRGFEFVVVVVVDDDVDDVGNGRSCCSCFTKSIESLCLVLGIRDVQWCDGFGLGDWEDDE